MGWVGHERGTHYDDVIVSRWNESGQRLKKKQSRATFVQKGEYYSRTSAFPSRRAQEHQAIVENVKPPETAVGEYALPFDPFPSCPLSFSPQQ